MYRGVNARRQKLPPDSESVFHGYNLGEKGESNGEDDVGAKPSPVTGVHQRTVAGGLRSALALVLVYLLSWAFLVVSWQCLYLSMTLRKAAFFLTHVFLSFTTTTAACACYLTLMCRLVVMKDPWGVISLLCRRGCVLARRFFPPLSSTSALRKSESLLTTRPSGLQLSRREWGILSLPLVDVALIHLIVSASVPAKYAQTKEIVLATVRCIHDVIYMTIATLLLCAHTANIVVPVLCQRFQARCRGRGQTATSAQALLLSYSGRRGCLASRPFFPGVVVFLSLLVFGVVPAITWAITRAWNEDVPRAMSETVLARNMYFSGKAFPSVDFCEAEGGRVSEKKLRRSWILPRVLPRRFFNFYMGSERCAAARDYTQPHTIPLGYVDVPTGRLLVPMFCPIPVPGAANDVKEVPRVFYERPWLSEMAPGDEEALAGRTSPSESTFPKYPTLPGDLLQRELERKYGSQQNEHHVMVHRDSFGKIREIELRVQQMPVNNVTVASAIPAKATQLMLNGWGGSGFQFYEIPLGVSPTVTVRCTGAEKEDVFIVPVKTNDESGLPKAPDTPAGASPALPPRNVLVLMLDAVSRPEMRRSLPQFVSWLNEFQRRSAADSFMVVEGRGHTTFGFSTGGNFVPSMTGTSALAEGADAEAYPNVSLFEKSLFALTKKKHGSRVATSLSMGYCHDALHGVFGMSTNKTTGNGLSPHPGLDRYLYGPMCRQEYSAQESNIRGPYSIRQRCIGRSHVHDLLLCYTKSLLTQHRIASESFFDVSYFIEGHEGSHSVLTQMDDSLTVFMEDLVEDGFFKDRRHVLVLYADHGSHMGPYFLSSEAGRMERTMPFLVFLFHTSLLSDMDRVRGRRVGATEHFFLERANGVTSPMDLFLTLADVLGVAGEAQVAPIFATSPWPPRSMFDPLPRPGTPPVGTSPSPTENAGIEDATVPPHPYRTSSEDLVNTSFPKLEKFPLATHWCEF